MSGKVELTRLEQAAMAALLGHCDRAGVVFVRSRDDRKLLKKAASLGLVDAGGALTSDGRRFREEAEDGTPHLGADHPPSRPEAR